MRTAISALVALLVTGLTPANAATTSVNIPSGYDFPGNTTKLLKSRD
jgi:hypothetical protein